MNFEGEWVTTSGHRATVIHERKAKKMKWLGLITIGLVHVPSFWDENGKNINPNLDLSEKRRGEEDWPRKKISFT